MFVERTNEEIAVFLRQRVEEPILFDFCSSDLMAYLSYPYAKEFIKPDVTEEQWNAALPTTALPRDEAGLRAAIREYLPFAFDKCDNERGLSAIRSIQHFEAWVWLLGDEEAIAFLANSDNYEPYGRPMLQYLDNRYSADKAAA
jgi:hypothetical protein